MTLGGHEYATLDLTEGLRKRGHDVQLIIRPHSHLERIAEERHVPYQTLFMGKPMYPWAILKMAFLLHKHQIDIIHTHASRDSWISGLAVKLSSRNTRMVLTRHKTTPIHKHFVNRLLYHSLVDTIVTTGGETTRRRLITEHGFNEAHVVAIPTGADSTQFSPDVEGRRFRDEIGVKKGESLIGAICFLRGYKGLDYFIDAARIVLEQTPHCRFVIVGDGPEKERLFQKITGMALEEKVVMVGHRDDVPEIMAALDVFVVSSTAGETLTQTIPQALLMEVPVVSTKVGSISDVVYHNKTGFLIPPGDAKALASQVVDVLRKKKLARETALEGRKLVLDCFSSESALEKNEMVYRSLLRQEIHCWKRVDVRKSDR